MRIPIFINELFESHEIDVAASFKHNQSNPLNSTHTLLVHIMFQINKSSIIKAVYVHLSNRRIRSIESQKYPILKLESTDCIENATFW